MESPFNPEFHAVLTTALGCDYQRNTDENGSWDQYEGPNYGVFVFPSGLVHFICDDGGVALTEDGEFFVEYWGDEPAQRNYN